MKLDRQSVIDALCLIVGSAVGAAASAVFLFHHWARQTHHGDPAKPGEPQGNELQQR